MPCTIKALNRRRRHQVLRTPRDFADTFTVILPRLAVIAVAVSGSKSDAEDIVQQAFTIALQKDETFETEQQFTGWIAAIVRNCALNYRRKTIRRKTYATDPYGMTPTASSVQEQPIDQSTGELIPGQKSFDDQVLAALNSMKEKARCCLLLRIVQELSYKEISGLMDMSEGTAMSLVHRSKMQLRKTLSENA